MAKKKLSIKLDPNNARLHNDDNRKLIKKSLSDLGVGRSIVIDNEDYVVAGNGVFETADALGIKTKVIESDGSELIVIKRTDLSYDDPKRRQLAIADNATGDLSTWDFEEVTEDEATQWGFEMEQIESEPEFFPSEVDGKDFDYPDQDLIQSHVRMVQLFLDTETEPEFRKMETELRDRFKTDNLTDTIFKAVKFIYEIHD